MLYELVLNPSVLQASNAPRIDFNTKVYFVKSIAPKPPEVGDFFWTAVSKVNGIRNKMAHGLESEKLDKSVTEFIKYMQDNDPIFNKRSLAYGQVSVEQLCIAGICAVYSFFTVYLQNIKVGKQGVTSA